MSGKNMKDVRYWLARLSFAFLAVAFVLAYEGYKVAQQVPYDAWKVRGYFLGAVLCFFAAIAGTSYRHRRR